MTNEDGEEWKGEKRERYRGKRKGEKIRRVWEVKKEKGKEGAIGRVQER